MDEIANLFNRTNLFFAEHELFYICFKLVLGFFVLLIVSRLMGKKKLQQYTVFDFIFIVLLSGLLEESLYHIETPWYYFVIGVIVWCLLNRIITKLEMRFEKLRPIIKGQPVFLIKKGQLNELALKESDLELEQLRHALRSKGVFSLFDVEFAILETNGEINVIKKEEEVDFPAMVIEDGRIVDEQLSGVPEEIVLEELQLYRLPLEKVAYAEIIGTLFYYKLKGGGDNGTADNETN